MSIAPLGPRVFSGSGGGRTGYCGGGRIDEGYREPRQVLGYGVDLLAGADQDALVWPGLFPERLTESAAAV